MGLNGFFYAGNGKAYVSQIKLIFEPFLFDLRTALDRQSMTDRVRSSNNADSTNYISGKRSTLKALDSFNGLTSMIQDEESEISKTYHLLSPIQWILHDGITKLNAMIVREEHKRGDKKEV